MSSLFGLAITVRMSPLTRIMLSIFIRLTRSRNIGVAGVTVILFFTRGRSFGIKGVGRSGKGRVAGRGGKSRAPVMGIMGTGRGVVGRFGIRVAMVAGGSVGIVIGDG